MDEGVGVDVAGKLHLLVPEELHANQVAHRVVFLVDGEHARVGHFLVGRVLPFAPVWTWTSGWVVGVA